jgi:hypothetical protein
MATKTTQKTAPATIVESSDIRLTHIHWPLWLKVSAILTATYSALMIVSFLYTIYVMASRASQGF